MSVLNISPIRAFSDNYIWLISRENQAYVVDPGEPAPVLSALDEAGLQLAGILVTHHHYDHTGAVKALKEASGCDVWGPPESPAGPYDHILAEGTTVSVLGVDFSVLAVPGHTLDHIAYHSGGEKALFCGDTLFVGGCGRVFEGTAPQMRASLSKLARLPADTRIFCAHEYTLANLHFAQLVEPDNADLARFIGMFVLDVGDLFLVLRLRHQILKVHHGGHQTLVHSQTVLLEHFLGELHQVAAVLT